MRPVILLAALLAACSGDSVEPEPRRVARITLDVDSLVLTAVGSQRTLTAKILDQHDQPFDLEPDWSSTSPAVATVVGGMVTARSNGSTNVSVGFNQFTASAKIIVRDTTTARVAGIWTYSSNYPAANGGTCELQDLFLRVEQNGRTLKGIWSGVTVTNVNPVTPYFHLSCGPPPNSSPPFITNSYTHLGRGTITGEVRADTVRFTMTSDSIRGSLFTTMTNSGNMRGDSIRGDALASPTQFYYLRARRRP